MKQLFKWFAGLGVLAVLWPASVHAQFQQRPTIQGGGGIGGAGDTSRQYYNSTMVGEAIVSSDPETRQLIVITDEETSQHIGQVITNLDQPKPQVLIKVLFLEVTYRDGYDIGLEGGIRRDLGATTLVASNLFGLASGFGAPGGGIYQILGTDYQATLTALAAAGKMEVLSRPSILARNNQQAVITVGQEVPFITDSRITDAGQTINTIQYDDIGIILRVTPFITSDNMIEMIVSPEISSLTDQTVPISAGIGPPVEAPIIAKRAADTVVVTADGQTVIIGGLMERTKTSTTSKIPILGDIPLLGALFRHKTKDESKTELMIFLTPQIIQRPGELAHLTRAERANNVLTPKSFTDHEIQRYMNRVPEADDEANNPAPPSRPYTDEEMRQYLRSLPTQ